MVVNERTEPLGSHQIHREDHMIAADSRTQQTRIITAIVLGLTIALTGPAIAAEGPHVVESNILVEKMWPTTPSPEEMREGIEAALKIPDWEPHDGVKVATSWTWVSGAMYDHTPSVEHDKIGRIRCAAWAWHNGLAEPTLWAGASAGGLYFLGRNPFIPSLRWWVPVSNTLPGSPSVGAFLVRAGNSNQILVGTGDWGRHGDEGTGLYRTTDGGVTWTRISMSPEPSHFFKLMINPSDAGGAQVYAATSEGVFISTDFGLTWENVYAGSASSGVTDIARATSSSDWILGVPGIGVVRCNILTTILSSCTPATGFNGNISRVSVAVTPANTNWVFALATEAPNDFNGIYRSSDGGSAFLDMDPFAPTDPIAWNQGKHTHAIAVDSVSPGRVIVGMAAAQMTLNATAASTFDICWHRNVGVSATGCGTTGLDAGHVDQTSMAFIPQSVAPGNTEILITNDGGITTYDWAADTHDDRFNEWGLNVSQTYNPATFDLSLSDPSRALAGLQDNGIVQISRDAASDQYLYLFGADGGAVSIQPGNPDRYAVTNGMAYNRYFWWDSGPKTPMNVNLPGGGTPTMTHNPFVSLPVTFTHDGRYLFWRWAWEEDNVDWRHVNPNHPLPSGLSVQNIVAARSDPLTIYITDWNSASNGTSALYVMEEGVTGTLGDMDWEDRTPSGSFVPDDPDGGWVFADRSTEHANYVTFATGAHRPSRIFLSPNKGVNWWDVTGDLADALPNVNYWQLVIHPADHHQLFLATEVGVFRSDNSGGHWYRYMDGLPSVVKVRGIQIHATGPDDAELVIATWGHGFWEREVEFQEGAIFGDGFETGSTDRWDDVVDGAP